MATALHHLSEEDIANVPDASNMCFGIVVAEWNKEITDALLNGAVSTLEKYGALPENIHVKTVPGSFELVYGARQMTKNDIAHLNASQNIPVIFGLLTTDDLQQAQERSGGKLGNKGSECAIDAIKMAKF